jgi:hypothetical protein
MAFLGGLTVAAVAALDSALLVYPTQFANLDWEFGTISGLIEGMPLLTVGFGAMVIAATANGWARWRRVLSIVALLMAVLLLTMLVIFALDLPVAMLAAQPAMKGSIKRVALKNLAMGSCYLVFYSALAIWTWRRLKAERRV